MSLQQAILESYPGREGGDKHEDAMHWQRQGLLASCASCAYFQPLRWEAIDKKGQGGRSKARQCPSESWPLQHTDNVPPQPSCNMCGNAVLP
jgi:hypothetical protein